MDPDEDHLDCLQVARLLYTVTHSRAFLFWRAGGPWSETHAVSVTPKGDGLGTLDMRHVGPGRLRA